MTDRRDQTVHGPRMRGVLGTLLGVELRQADRLNPLAGNATPRRLRRSRAMLQPADMSAVRVCAADVYRKDRYILVRAARTALPALAGVPMNPFKAVNTPVRGWDNDPGSP